MKKQVRFILTIMISLAMLLSACTPQQNEQVPPPPVPTATAEPQPTAIVVATATTATKIEVAVDSKESWAESGCKDSEPAPAHNWLPQEFGIKEVKKNGKKEYYQNHGSISNQLVVVIKPGTTEIEKVIEISGGKLITEFGISIPEAIKGIVSLDPPETAADQKDFTSFNLLIKSGWEREYDVICDQLITGHILAPKDERLDFTIRVIFDPGQ